MQFEPLEIPDVVLVVPKRLGDHRGFFSETYKKSAFDEAGIEADFIQDNHSLSREKGVLRGLHFQTPPFAQGKLVRCVRGSILDLAVDIRVGSLTYGQHVMAVLSAENGAMLWVPEGFAHGFCTLEPDSEVLYKVTSGYSPLHDRGLAYDDPALGISWPFPHAELVLSDKDRKHPLLADLPSYFHL